MTMRRRLVLLFTATSALVLIAFLVPLAVLVRTSAAERATAVANSATQALAPVVVSSSPAQLHSAVDRVAAQTGYQITVFFGDGAVLGTPAARTATVLTAVSGTSLTTDTPSGREVLVAVAGLDSGTAVIRVFVPSEELSRGVAKAWAILGLLGLSLLTVSVLVADRLSRTVTGPLSAVARVAERLARGELEARAEPAGPREIRKLGAGLNVLAGRIGELVAAEREAAADLSHRLRTPLTALRIDAEGLQDAGERYRVLRDLDALERTVDTVIRLARRHDLAAQASTRHHDCDASAVTSERVRFWSALADEEHRAFDAAVQEGVTAPVSSEDLSVCLDALLGNVFSHTPEGCRFSVELRAGEPGQAWLIVADHGPGLPPSALERGVSLGGSTGLGLDIVRRTAEGSGGALFTAPTAGGGTTMIVRLGASAEGH